MAKKITSLHEVLVDQLKDLYSAESQIIKALPKLAKAATAPDLKKGFELHLEQTKGHAARIKSICEEMKEKPTGKKCMATAGLVEEGQEAIDENATPEMKDVMLIAAAQRVEHYEIAGLHQRLFPRQSPRTCLRPQEIIGNIERGSGDRCQAFQGVRPRYFQGRLRRQIAGRR